MANNNVIYNGVLSGVTGGSQQRWNKTVDPEAYNEFLVNALLLANGVDAAIPTDLAIGSAQGRLIADIAAGFYTTRYLNGPPSAEAIAVIVAQYTKIATGLLSEGGGFTPASGAALRNDITTAPFADQSLGGAATVLPITASLANIVNTKRYGVRAQFFYRVTNLSVDAFSSILQVGLVMHYDALPPSLFWLWTQAEVEVLAGQRFQGFFSMVTTKELPAVASAALMTVDVRPYFPAPLPVGVTAEVYSLSAGGATVELTEYAT